MLYMCAFWWLTTLLNIFVRLSLHWQNHDNRWNGGTMWWNKHYYFVYFEADISMNENLSMEKWVWNTRSMFEFEDSKVWCLVLLPTIIDMINSKHKCQASGVFLDFLFLSFCAFWKCLFPVFSLSFYIAIQGTVAFWFSILFLRYLYSCIDDPYI